MSQRKPEPKEGRDLHDMFVVAGGTNTHWSDLSREDRDAWRSLARSLYQHIEQCGAVAGALDRAIDEAETAASCAEDARNYAHGLVKRLKSFKRVEA